MKIKAISLSKFIFITRISNHTTQKYQPLKNILTITIVSLSLSDFSNLEAKTNTLKLQECSVSEIAL